MLGLLTATLPLDLALAGVAATAGALRPMPPVTPTTTPRTVLLSGAKMTKALALARAFHRAGHRVVLVETTRYRWSGHRFSNCVDAFRVVPPADHPDYPGALARIVEEEGVDVYVPVCSPLSSRYEAEAAAALGDRCEVIHVDADVICTLDDKDAFAASADPLGLAAPETHRITDPSQVIDFDFERRPGRRYLLKSIPYDPVHRLDMTLLPLATAEATAAHVRSLPISEERPWVLQEFIEGDEYCTHGTVRGGNLQVWACCRSSPSQLNYEMVDRPDIEKWVRTYVEALGLTGQVSLDFIVDADDRAVAIECNPRTHSAITMFYDHPDLARGYLEDGIDTLVPLPDSRPTYWWHMELWRMITDPRNAPSRMREVLRGREALLDPHDPLPFVLVPHLQIASLLLGAFVHGTDWVKIDINIGKLVEPGGD
ncbi:MAG: ATP-grasp domain-containing protein [Acidimicrobiales bacterium]